MVYWKSDWDYNLLGKYKYKLLLEVNENEVVKIPDYIKGKISNDDIFFHHGNNGIEKIECNYPLTVYVLDENKESEDKEVKTEMKINHEYTDEIVCPWCSYEFSDSWELGNGGECTELEECPDCNKKFYASRMITVEYSTEKAIYGTCTKCSKGNVVVESQKSSFNSYCDFCLDCIKESEKQAREEYFKKIMEHRKL